MINLIPPTAKKKIVLEYWTRVVSVWFLTWSATLVLGAFVMIPTYVLINLQVSSFSDSAATASQKIATMQDVSKDLTVANNQAKALIDSFKFSSLSDSAKQFTQLENSDLTLSQISIGRTKEGVGPVMLSGEASNRQALADFRDRLLASPQVDGVDLPISNLAKDKDIQFTLTVTMKKTTL